jgi:hypothetical protein
VVSRLRTRACHIVTHPTHVILTSKPGHRKKKSSGTVLYAYIMQETMPSERNGLPYRSARPHVLLLNFFSSSFLASSLPHRVRQQIILQVQAATQVPIILLPTLTASPFIFPFFISRLAFSDNTYRESRHHALFFYLILVFPLYPCTSIQSQSPAPRGRL